MQLHAYPHELGLISLLLDGHRRAVRNIVQPFISSIVQRLSRLVLPRIIRYLIVSLQHDSKLAALFVKLSVRAESREQATRICMLLPRWTRCQDFLPRPPTSR